MLFPLADLIQRIIVAPLARFRPARRDEILDTWMQWCARITLHGVVECVGGARSERIPEIEAGPDVLLLMNHQSLLDIPIAVRALRGNYPSIVTRRRYARRIPLVSHMLRLYDMPLVDPGKRSRDQFEDLAARARTMDRPLVLFPEGTRTRNGEIGNFKRGGLRAVLSQRNWTVYLLVVDGFWRCARLNEFVRGIAGVRGRVRLVGPFEVDAATVDPDAFADAMRAHMRDTLASLRSDAGHPEDTAVDRVR